MRNGKRIVGSLLALALLAGCGQTAAGPDNGGTNVPDEENIYIEAVQIEEVDLEDEAVALAEGPAALNNLLLPEASGVSTVKNSKATIDYSNTKDGYVMVNFTASTTKRLKVQVAGPTTTYTYNLPANAWTTFPLSDGNGDYKITVFENTTDTKYASVATVTTKVTLTDEFVPFVRPNQYVDYGGAVNTVAKAQELVGSETDPLKKVELIYNFVVNNLTYDKEKAQSVQSGYLPVLDTVLSAKKGICFDYAALMAGMLRSQGVPCKLVVGYAGTAYHAWISVWTEETGWIDGAIYFDGTTWQRMDPTFASSSNSSAAIMQYIGDGSNYTTKYVY